MVNHKPLFKEHSSKYCTNIFIWSECLENVASLIKAGANVNAANRDGNTPLHLIASLNGNYDLHYAIAVLLAKNGANINATNSEGKTPKDVSRYESSKFTNLQLYLLY